MDIAGLVVAVCALAVTALLVVVARREAFATRVTLAYMAQLVGQANANAQQARAQAERARAEAQSARMESVATRCDISTMRELLSEIRDEACGPVTVRPAKLAAARAQALPTATEPGPQE